MGVTRSSTGMEHGDQFGSCEHQTAKCEKHLANIKRTCYFVPPMDESRKKLIYLVAGMFLVRRLAGLDRRPSPALEGPFRDAIDDAVELMRRIDAWFVC